MESITTSKGFKILKLSKFLDAIQLFEGGLGICDSCNEDSFGGYYIAVLNRFYCKKCFERWHEEAVYYPEDARFEQQHFEYYFNKAIKLGFEIK